MKRKLKDHRPIDFNMLEDSARTGYVDVILAIVGLLALPVNIEVGFVLLVWSLYVAVANRLPSFHRIPRPEATHPARKSRAQRARR